MHWLIDGNNLLHLLPEILWAVPPQGRAAALAAALKPYRDARSLKVTLVFDGGDSEHNGRLSGIAVAYSGPEKSADQLILERLSKAPAGSAGVVSNDQGLCNAAKLMGAGLARADMLAQKLQAGSGVADEDKTGWNFSTRKKGPARRLPKAKRRQKNLLDKF